MNLPGYDAWKLGGDPHTSTGDVKCSNLDCGEYSIPIDVPVHVEYGMAEMIDDTCPACRKPYLVWGDEKLAELCEDCHALEDDCICEYEEVEVTA